MSKRAKTHLARNSVLCNETEAGINHTDVRGHMGLERSTATDVYLRGSYWTRPMLGAAGWGDQLDSFYCWWEGEESNIPAQLLQMGKWSAPRREQETLISAGTKCLCATNFTYELIFDSQ